MTGGDRAWVNDIFTQLERAIATAKPQALWFRRHPTLLLHLVALGAGSLIQLIISALFEAITVFVGAPPVTFSLAADSPWRAAVTRLIPILYAVLWVTRWLTGFWFAFEIRSWFLGLWPNIELDLGSDHLKTEQIQRRRLKAVWVLVVLPVVASILRDLFVFGYDLR